MCAHKGSIETLDYLIASGADFNIADRWISVLLIVADRWISVLLIVQLCRLSKLLAGGILGISVPDP
jgi:hypothetical protein